LQQSRRQEVRQNKEFFLTPDFRYIAVKNIDTRTNIVASSCSHAASIFQQDEEHEEKEKGRGMRKRKNPPWMLDVVK